MVPLDHGWSGMQLLYPLTVAAVSYPPCSEERKPTSLVRGCVGRHTPRSWCSLQSCGYELQPSKPVFIRFGNHDIYVQQDPRPANTA